MDLMGQGADRLSNADIPKELFLSKGTVRHTETLGAVLIITPLIVGLLFEYDPTVSYPLDIGVLELHRNISQNFGNTLRITQSTIDR